MNQINTATYLGVQQAATASGVTLPPNLIRQLTRTLVIARITAPSTKALAYFLQAVLNAPVGFQALHLTQPQHMLQAAATTVRRAWSIHGHRPTSLPATVRAASPPYYRDNIDHLVNNAYKAHTAAHLHRPMHNHEPQVREVLMLTLREAQYHHNTCPHYILHQRGLPTQVGTRVWNHLQLQLPHHQHVIQTNHRCRETGPLAVLHTDVGRGPTGSTTTLDRVGTTLHLVQVTPNQMRALHWVGTHHIPFLQHPEWPNKTLLENHMRSAATQTEHLQPTDGEVREAYNPYWNTHKRPLPPSPARGNQAHHRPLEQVENVPSATVPAVLLVAPNGLKATLRPGRAGGNLWMLPRPTARPFCLPPLSQDKLTITPATCWRCGPQALDDPWPLLQLLAGYHPMPTAHATPEQHRWLHTHFERAAERDTATVVWGPSAKAERRFHRGTWDTQYLAITFAVLAKHRSATPEAPAYPVKPQCSQVQDWQTVEWTTFQPQTVYLLQYVYGYLTQGHERNNDYVSMNPAKTGIIRQGVGVYATRRLWPDANTLLDTMERGAHIHAYQPTIPCRLPRPDDHNTVIFVDASSTTSLTPVAGGAASELKADTTGRLHQHRLTGATIFGASSHGELKILAIVVDAVNDTHQEPRDHTHHVWVVVDAAVGFQIVRRPARQPLHKATDSSLGTQALHLWTALQHLPGHVVLHLVKQESHRYSLGNGHIDLHAHNQPAEHMPDNEDPPLQDHTHTHLQHLPLVPRPGEPPAWVPDDRIYKDTGRAYHYPQPVRTMAHIRGSQADHPLLSHLQHTMRTALYFSALDPSLIPVHLQTRGAQLLLEQLPLLDRVARWYARRGIDIPPEYTICPCHLQQPETSEHFKQCPLAQGGNHLATWTLEDTIAQHAGWGPATPPANEVGRLMGQPEIKEAVLRGAVPLQLYRVIADDAPEPRATIRHMHLTAVKRADAQLQQRVQVYAQEAQ